MLLQPCRIFGMDAMRRAEITRKTKETQVRAAVNLDGEGRAKWIDRHVEDLNPPYGLAWRGDEPW